MMYNGEIINACTNARLNFLDNNSFVSCPQNVCDCDVQWNYEKYERNV
jgi:hypothetical protein